MIWSEAKEYMESYEKDLTAHDFYDYHYVYVHHEDGSVFTYRHAFCIEKDNWYFVFSEHNGCNYFSKDDCYVHAYIFTP